MKTYTSEELKVIIEKHGKWLFGEAGGGRANLRRATVQHVVGVKIVSIDNIGTFNGKATFLFIGKYSLGWVLDGDA